ncbi:MAG: glycosyltransferase [Clostridiales bacterium]|nr:glycosyltransferase [Candidatus Equinaster intestinalis]
MRIVVNDIAASSGGAMAILKQFYQYVRDNDKSNEWIFLLSDSYLEETDNIKIKVITSVKKSGLHKLWFDFVSGSRFINSLKPDIVFSMQNILTFGVKAPQYVYIHQSIPFQHQKNFSLFIGSERPVAIYQHLIGRIIKLSAKKSDGFIVQTEWMKREVLSSINNTGKKCLAAFPDVPGFKVDASKISAERLFFYPTNEESYKNISAIEEAVNILKTRNLNDYRVVLTIKKENTDNFEYSGRLNFEQMCEMYSKAVLLFPSYIETVGLPLLEAMQFGAVIFAADCDYAHETIGDYKNAYYFNPWKPDELADLMQKYLNGEIKREIGISGIQKKSEWSRVFDFLLG